MAVCYSAAWDAKIITSAWWVHPHQVSKTAPTGEYLTTGSFMIRGKKNFLPPSYLMMGFGFLFKVDEQCVWRHRGERKVKTLDEDMESVTSSTATLLIEGEELVGDNSSNEGECEEEGGEDEKEEADRDAVKGGVDVEEQESEEMSLKERENVQEEPEEAEQEEEEEEEVEEQQEGSEREGGSSEPCVKAEELPEEMSFPDTTIPLSHLHSNRYIYAEEWGLAVLLHSERSLSLRDMKKKKQKQDAAEDQEDAEEEPIPGDASSSKEDKGKKGKKGKGKEDLARKGPQKPVQKVRPEGVPVKKPEPQDGEEEGRAGEEGQELDEKDADDVDQENPAAEDGETLLASLTGQPHPEDVLLFAVPVCAPYTALTSYKYKVKLTPGTQKKGKAARTAVLSFMRAKESTAREKDLLRSVKDTDLSRNLPGKVKVSAPNLLAAKKK
ncbi:hypothetical protein Z043_119619 [Scleropages formosus]|uniref:Uncharacterized protein n=1 Tax=Scleropages formosus TaxID=113540 RepID=A0A0P7TX12_SCLFO|nr:hypothetical protein Z043_119619 [Scleropages formosus]